MEIDIKNYIELNIEELKNKLFPLFTTELNTLAATYTFLPIDGGLVKQSQLELRVISCDYDETKEIEDKLNKILDFKNDTFITYGNTYFRSSLSGGGIVYNEGIQMYENTIMYTIKWRDIDGGNR